MSIIQYRALGLIVQLLMIIIKSILSKDRFKQLEVDVYKELEEIGNETAWSEGK